MKYIFYLLQKSILWMVMLIHWVIGLGIVSEEQCPPPVGRGVWLAGVNYVTVKKYCVS